MAGLWLFSRHIFPPERAVDRPQFLGSSVVEINKGEPYCFKETTVTGASEKILGFKQNLKNFWKTCDIHYCELDLEFPETAGDVLILCI